MKKTLAALAALALAGVLVVVVSGSAVAQAPPAQVAEAIRLMGEKKFAEAEEILVKFTEANPQAPNAWLQLGMARYSQQKWEGAVEAFDKAAAFPQVRGQALYNKACVHSLTKETDKAIQALSDAIAAGFVDRELFRTDSDLEHIRSDARFAGLIPPILKGADAFVEPSRVIHLWDGEAAADQFGWVCSKVGDVDGDEVTDIAMTALTFGGNKGKVYVHSGKSGKLLFAVEGAAGAMFGNGVCGLGDVNGDGTPDVGACGFGGKGIAKILSGKDGKQILEVQGTAPGETFGAKISGIGDVNGDKTPDFVVTAMQAGGGKGACIGYSGKDGSELFKVEGEAAADLFGSSVAGFSDGKNKLLAIGAQDAGEGDRGKVYLYDLSSGKPVAKGTVDSNAQSQNLGQMFLSWPGDFNKDGIADFFCSDFGHGGGVGRVLVASGADGKVLLEVVGKDQGEALGTSISDAGDATKDGIPDLIVGAWQNRQGARSGGRAYLIDGATGKTIRTWTCKQAGDTFGFDATGVGDVDGDGAIDFAVTSAWSNIKGVRTGRVFVVSGA